MKAYIRAMLSFSKKILQFLPKIPVLGGWPGWPTPENPENQAKMADFGSEVTSPQLLLRIKA